MESTLKKLSYNPPKTESNLQKSQRYISDIAEIPRLVTTTDPGVLPRTFSKDGLTAMYRSVNFPAPAIFRGRITLKVEDPGKMFIFLACSMK